MKKIVLLFLIAVSSLILFSQEQKHEVSVVNIEIPVRVFQGDNFIDNLNIEDFDVFEDGVLQKIEAVYLIKKKSVTKEEGNQKFFPSVTRNFILMFEIIDYLPKIGESIDYFFNNILLPGDELTVFTPVKSYKFNTKSFEMFSKETIAAKLKETLRTDSITGNSEYRSVLRELENTLSMEELDIDERMSLFRQVLSRFEKLRSINEEGLINFASFLKEKEGQKNVFMFYQKDVVPQFKPTEIERLASENQDRIDIVQNLTELFEFFRREININVDNVKKIFSDSSISMHFLYITQPPFRSSDTSRSGAGQSITFSDQSENVFSTFQEMSRATGGFSGSAFNATETFKKALDASENYYLVYYSPLNYKQDGEFKNVKVRVKGKNYRITHRAGYFAD
ncbi:MAG: hypothetical protein MUP98_06775 [Candidatus Aminicenantes bacterium]|nr:hypothetical protein [Candidatus Aminicenantes bacterium]